MKTILKNLSLMLAVLFSLCSCLDIWVNPVADVQDAQIDEQLIGTWFSTVDPASKTTIHIHEIDEHSMYLYIVDPMDPGTACEQKYVRMHVSELDGRTFMNWRTFNCNTKKFSRYLILEYEFNGENEVIFYHTNYDFVTEAIENKRLSGNAHAGDTIVVTAASAEIREFIENSPKEELFYRDNPFILKRFKRSKDAKRSICILF